MPSTKPMPNDALTFATSWVARNIEVGPFSWNDPPIYDGPISDFRKEAAQAGFSETHLERGIGAVPAFIAKAYADAVVNWRAAQKLENTRTGHGT
ncbi:hypothetical protein [Sphingomonas sp.]|uniref:hypothetical protein n=1 Tax=Sphingomonas sp. TaxID=28214 RepID=UPI0025D521CB|nr:hypothetical protein [Sphingomonas sp.]